MIQIRKTTGIPLAQGDSVLALVTGFLSLLAGLGIQTGLTAAVLYLVIDGNGFVPAAVYLAVVLTLASLMSFCEAGCRHCAMFTFRRVHEPLEPGALPKPVDAPRPDPQEPYLIVGRLSPAPVGKPPAGMPLIAEQDAMPFYAKSFEAAFTLYQDNHPEVLA